MDSGLLWIVGAGAAFTGSVLSNFGVNIQKYSQNANLEKPPVRNIQSKTPVT